MTKIASSMPQYISLPGAFSSSCGFCHVTDFGQWHLNKYFTETWEIHSALPQTAQLFEGEKREEQSPVPAVIPSRVILDPPKASHAPCVNNFP